MQTATHTGLSQQAGTMGTTTSKAFRLEDHSAVEPGLFSLVFDDPAEKVNKLSPAVMEELSAHLDALRGRQDIKALVFISGKPSIFIAGADIEVIRGIRDPQEGSRLARDGQAIVQKLSQLPFPVIAAINGASMGGGTEAALCCRYIVVSDNPATKIALPEVNLGVLPGFGGTVRLPARIGLQNAMDYILTGKNMTADKALKLGFADAVLPQHGFEERVLKLASKIIRGQFVRRKKRKALSASLTAAALEKTPVGRQIMFSQARKMIMSRTHGHYPGPLRILEVLKTQAGRGLNDALAIEQKAFGELSVTDVSKRLIDLFYAMEAVKKQTGVPGFKLDTKDRVERVALLGSGVMGGGIAQLAASRGIPVRMKDIDQKALLLGTGAAAKLFAEQVKKRKLSRREADMKMSLISPSLDYVGFSQADLVIEAVVENMDIKKKVLKETEAAMHEGAVFATNTSSLSVTELATASSRPENVVGMHFFNPVHRMPLVEVIRGEKTGDRAAALVFELSKRMGKTPIVVKDGPGFLVNRLLMPYLNEASYLMAEGAPIEELDKLVVKWGMPMGPATLLDEIGIDVGVKVAKILNNAFGERLKPSKANDKLYEAKLLGKKSGKGFYVYDERGKRQQLNPDIYNVLGAAPEFPSSEKKQEWIPRMIYPMINEAALCLADGIVATPQDVDLGMIMGTGFPPFRGGPLRFADALGVDKVVEKLEDLAKKVGPRFAPSQALLDVAKRGKGFYGS